MEWYTERALSEVSLGGILILVVIRTIQYNMLKMRDKYLHTNCLAALANMSSQFKNLHPYVSQRIVSMFEALAKKHARLVTTLQQSAGEDLEGDKLDKQGGSVVAMSAFIINCPQKGASDMFCQLNDIGCTESKQRPVLLFLGCDHKQSISHL